MNLNNINLDISEERERERDNNYPRTSINLRYCLNSPDRFVYLWLNVLTLIQDWNKDYNVMYLTDTVIRAAFFHLDSRMTMANMFQNLFCVSVI